MVLLALCGCCCGCCRYCCCGPLVVPLTMLLPPLLFILALLPGGWYVTCFSPFHSTTPPDAAAAATALDTEWLRRRSCCCCCADEDDEGAATADDALIPSTTDTKTGGRFRGLFEYCRRRCVCFWLGVVVTFSRLSTGVFEKTPSLRLQLRRPFRLTRIARGAPSTARQNRTICDALPSTILRCHSTGRLTKKNEKDAVVAVRQRLLRIPTGRASY